nr:MAG TPA: leucine rich repeat protein [Caudoviricetes sp.]DAT78985.1 MAG TPA: leucine-rich repeat protein [Caudoviricetes sp.]DAX46517.1 MAG TPA: leucine-rich repeat protein [Caudoviricetes sp.]
MSGIVKGYFNPFICDCLLFYFRIKKSDDINMQ